MEKFIALATVAIFLIFAGTYALAVRRVASPRGSRRGS
jgi:hypothetical protein